MADTPNCGIPYVPEGALDPAAGLNDALIVIDALLQTAVLNMDQTAPPGSPSDGDLHIVASPATGSWVGQEGNLARYVADGAFWQFYEAGAQIKLVLNLDDGGLYAYTSGAWGSAVPGGAVSSVNGDIGAVIVPVPIGIACSDETTPLTTGAGKATFRMPFAMTLTSVRASLTTAQATSGAGGIFTVDINEAGVSILSTKITIDNSEKTSTTAASAPVISDTSLADDAEISIDIDQIGDGTARGLKVWLIGYPT